MKRLLKMPKMQLTVTLLLIFISALFNQFSISIFFRFVLAIVLTVLVDLILLRVRKIELFFPSAGLATGCIIGLLFATDLPVRQLVIVILLAMFSKHFLRRENRQIFNPAGFGLFFGSLFFRNDLSWWAVSFQQLTINLLLLVSFLILLLPGYVSLVRMRRYRIIISFILTYALINFFLNKTIMLFDPTVIFFSLVMLPEPMTTPNKPTSQILFGIFVAIVSIFISFPFSIFNSQFSTVLPDPLIAGLLVGNMTFLKFR